MMKVVANLGHHHGPFDDVVTLSYEQRTKGRFKTITDSGEELGVFLDRGKVLQEGDGLKTEDQKLVRVACLPEALTEARCEDWLTFARCCYHLGNRHVPLQVGDRWVRFQPDHVLEDMVRLLGLSPTPIVAAFTPENGAYAGGHHH